MNLFFQTALFLFLDSDSDSDFESDSDSESSNEILNALSGMNNYDDDDDDHNDSDENKISSNICTTTQSRKRTRENPKVTIKIEPSSSSSSSSTTNNNNNNLPISSNQTDIVVTLMNGNDSYFKEQFRMSKETFNFVLNQYKDIQSVSRQLKRRRIDEHDIQRDFMIFFYYLSTQCPINDITKKFNLENSIICLNIIKKIEEFIINNLQDMYMTWPKTITEQKLLSKDFRNMLRGRMRTLFTSPEPEYTQNNLSSCIGILTYKVIKIKKQITIVTKGCNNKNIKDQNEKLLITQNVIDFSNIFRHTEAFFIERNTDNVESTDNNNFDELEIFKKSMLYQNNSNSFRFHQKYFLNSNNTDIERYLSSLSPSSDKLNASSSSTLSLNSEWIKNIEIMSDDLKDHLGSIQSDLFQQIESRYPRLKNLELYKTSSSSCPDPANIYKSAVILHNMCLNHNDNYNEFFTMIKSE